MIQRYNSIPKRVWYIAGCPIITATTRGSIPQTHRIIRSSEEGAATQIQGLHLNYVKSILF